MRAADRAVEVAARHVFDDDGSSALFALFALLPWLLRMAPIAALAGILVYTGFKMVKPSQLKELAEYGRGNVSVYLVTALVIVATDLLMGVMVGIGFALLRLALRSARLHLNLKPRLGATRFRDLVTGTTLKHF